ncbi:MAG: hypothetical protein U1F43_18915 [Myxococcota bacterium]
MTGDTGATGAAGFDALLRTSTAPAGACATGGVLVEAGLDADRNKTLDDGEVDQALSQGLKGDQGIQGLKGDQGIQGLKGDQGDQGIQGIQGIQGVKGDQGIQGLKGDQGIQGLKGDQGDQGIQGIQGIQGLKGDQGIQGLKGDQGDQGIQGIQGLKGDQGIQGIQGLKGDKGDKGDTGPAGSGGLVLLDKNGVKVGTVVGYEPTQKNGIKVVTSGGYVVTFQPDGTVLPAQIYYGGANCSGAALLNNGGDPNGGKLNGDTVVFSRALNTLMVPATIDANGASATTSATVQSIDNPTCANFTSGTRYGYSLVAATAASLGLPSYPLAAPLSVQ